MVRPLIARVFLALLLLFAQQQAIVHELQHGIDAVSGKTNPASPLHEVCLKCLAFAGMDHSPAPEVPTFALPEFEQPHFATARWSSHASREARPYQSRAPPLNS